MWHHLGATEFAEGLVWKKLLRQMAGIVPCSLQYVNDALDVRRMTDAVRLVGRPRPSRPFDRRTAHNPLCVVRHSNGRGSGASDRTDSVCHTFHVRSVCEYLSIPYGTLLCCARDAIVIISTSCEWRQDWITMIGLNGFEREPQLKDLINFLFTF